MAGSQPHLLQQCKQNVRRRQGHFLQLILLKRPVFCRDCILGCLAWPWPFVLLQVVELLGREDVLLTCASEADDRS
jgi:hypothetical protein